jgi:hypothetical protein
MTSQNPMFPPAPADRATSPSIVPFPTQATDRTTRRKALLGILAAGLATGAASAAYGLGANSGARDRDRAQ